MKTLPGIKKKATLEPFQVRIAPRVSGVTEINSEALIFGGTETHLAMAQMRYGKREKQLRPD